jgi:serine/threonine-protein kinase RsbT
VNVFPVRGAGDVVVARSQAQRLARGHGLPPRRSLELAIVVSELASNIVKYGVRGQICLDLAPPAVAGGGPAEPYELVVTARDVGPPIRDLNLAFTDGCDDRGPIDPAALGRRGGLGSGLGAVARLADRLTFTQDDHGKVITAIFLLTPARA